MAEYRITFARSARHELEVLDPSVIRRILPKIESLATHPRPHGSRKLTGAKNLWRIRIGDYRVIYSIFDNEGRIDITAVRHRREAYE
ncbi:MAG: type II toxin-antitoxin system RelE/ParE family toxin [Nitrospirae bacterium]|nr:type II toxin-antitoxin system RelE/ParE family toxin [Nitrospirota bacterium]MBU6479388.1 type II toxin-antitoxin system RelE/ParE family toxin [Nitrospirota bacterium]MDE3041788.1 type II toxin-antitoxin system RelE/ParE family toxin [Nitrospirota bacterium]MDE3218227.1 type II toxin-antitoxin system RelE/ParE family toxin [Nitrospirota bacterium]